MNLPDLRVRIAISRAYDEEERSFLIEAVDRRIAEDAARVEPQTERQHEA